MTQETDSKVLLKDSNLRGASYNNQKDVRIVSEDGRVDDGDVTISKKAAEQVTWHAHGSDGATIEFSTADGSPFYEPVFREPAKGSVTSGPAMPSAVVDKYYKYTVKGKTGSTDPGVIIHN